MNAKFRTKSVICLVLLAFGLVSSVACSATTLRIGLASDPGDLDPTTVRLMVTVAVLNSMCDKLIEMAPDETYVPRLATSWTWSDDGKALQLKIRPGVKFHDGEPLDAAAVKYSLDRHRLMRGSVYLAGLSPITDVEVIDDLTVKVKLSTPLPGPLFSRFVSSAGMIVSPKAAQAAGDRFGSKPICAGPYRIVERVIQDHITLERFSDYWEKDRIDIDQIIYRIMPDSTVRIANLLAGSLDLIEQVSPTDVPTITKDRRFQVSGATSLGHNRIYINVGNGERTQTALSRDARVRQAFSLAIDRDALNQVLFDGQYVPASSWISPTSRFYLKSIPVKKRDLSAAKALLTAAGERSPKVELTLLNVPAEIQVAEMIQAMTREAGFDVKLRLLEIGTATHVADRGNFEALLIGWSGQVDPDHNIYSVLHCTGTLNYGRYCEAEVDRLLDAARASSDVDERVRLYTKMLEILTRDEPYIFLYHRRWLWGHTGKLKNFVPYPDGMIRVLDLRLD